MRLNRFNPLSLLASPHALSWQNHVVFFGLAILALGFFDIDRLGGNFASWFVVFLVGFITTVSMIELFKRLTKNKTNPTLRVSWLLAGLVIAGIVRGLVVFETGFLLGLIPESELLYRLMSAPLFVLSAYFLSNALVASFLSFREQANNLSSELERLNLSRNSYQSDLQLVNQQQRNRVQELLSAPMWELQKKLETATNPDGVRDALLTMQSINNEVIRPLSHELSASVGEQKPLVSTSSNPPQWRPALPERVNLSQTQPAWLFFGVLLVLSLNSQISLSSVNQGLQTVTLGALPVALFFLIERWLFRNVELTIPAAVTFSTLFGVVGSAIGGTLVQSLGLSITDLFWWQAISLVVMLKTTTLVYGILLVGWQQTLQRLALVNSQQKLVNSRLRQQLWLGQKALAMELHGSVQATLQALAIRLSRMQETNLQEIQTILAAVRQSLSRIENQEYLAGQPFNSLLLELRDLWEGTAEISWQIEDAAKQELEKDLGLARCTFEVIRESVTNAVKHGSASAISIEIQRSENVLKLKISNNGSVAENQQYSMGSELMEQLCLSVALVGKQGEVVLLAELALNPEFAV